MLLHRLRLALLMPLAPSHNLLVRGSNRCGGTNQLASVLTLTSRDFLLVRFQTHDRVKETYRRRVL